MAGGAVVKELTDMTSVEQVCWLASRDGGRVDMKRPRSRSAEAKITAARLEGAIDEDGWLTPLGHQIAEAVS